MNAGYVYLLEMIAGAEGCDPQEAAFLRAIVADPDDEVTRVVYADWLEEDGREPMARYLRLDAERNRTHRSAERFGELTNLLAYLKDDLDPRWCAGLERPARVFNCGAADVADRKVRFTYQCPNRWQDLTPTADAAIRYCAGCKKNVHACDTKAEAEEHAWGGRCVAISSRLALTVLADPIPDESECRYEMAGVLLPPEWTWGEDLFSRKPKPKPKKPWWQFW